MPVATPVALHLLQHLLQVRAAYEVPESRCDDLLPVVPEVRSKAVSLPCHTPVDVPVRPSQPSLRLSHLLPVETLDDVRSGFHAELSALAFNLDEPLRERLRPRRDLCLCLSLRLHSVQFIIIRFWPSIT